MELHERKWLQELLFTSTMIMCLRITAAAPHLSTFSSHVSFNTPTSSFSHGVGDLKPVGQSRNLYRNINLKAPHRYGTIRSLHYGVGSPIGPSASVYREDKTFRGYQVEKPLVPFHAYPSLTFRKPISSYSHISTVNDNNIGHISSYSIPVLPPSPYRVNSPNAEPLWPEGLYLPPSVPGQHSKGHANTYLPGHYDNDDNEIDPYLLEGFEAVQAFDRIIAHGELFHHEIPHVRALLANQKLRLKNGLHPNRLGSIRSTSPWHRS